MKNGLESSQLFSDLEEDWTNKTDCSNCGKKNSLEYKVTEVEIDEVGEEHVKVEAFVCSHCKTISMDIHESVKYLNAQALFKKEMVRYTEQGTGIVGLTIH